MAEVIALVASIATLVQLASEAANYVASASGAASERKRLREEIRSCEYFLQKLKDELSDADEGKLWSETIGCLGGPDAPLDRLQVALAVVTAKLAPKKGLKKAIAVLKWPFDESEVGKIVSTIERQKSLLHLALTNDSRKLMKEIKQSSADNEKKIQELKVMLKGIQLSQDAVQQYALDEQTQKILSWLSPLDYWEVQEQNLKRRQDGTGHWMLKHPRYVDWLEGRTKVLWCPGIPGAGKSVMASFVTSHLQSTKATSRIGVCIVAFDYKRQNSTSVAELFLSLARQLLEQYYSHSAALPNKVRELHSKHQVGMRSLDPADIDSILDELVPLYDTVFLIVDALDECKEDLQEAIIESLQRPLFRDLRLLCTSRPLPLIRGLFRNKPSIEITAKAEDIKIFVNGQIQNIVRLRDHVRDNPSLEDGIIEGITNKAEGMFLLARFHLDSLATKSSLGAIRSTLANLPTTLSTTYEKSMDIVLSQPKDDVALARMVLIWITLAFRPLTMRELQHAIAAMRFCTASGLEDYVAEDELPKPNIILGVCAGLVEAPGLDSDPDAHVRFVHYTAQQYFRKTMRAESPAADTDITTTCVGYLSLDSFNSGPCPTDEKFELRLKRYPLYAYAAQNWGHHARKASETGSAVGNLMLEFLRNDAKLSSSIQALPGAKHSADYQSYGQQLPSKMSALHLVTYFGVLDALASLLKTERNPDTRDSWGRTPLWWAVERGYPTVCMLLVAREGVDVNAKDRDGQTPLVRATENEDMSVFKVLINKKGVQLDSKDDTGQNALLYAAKQGHAGMVQLLLEKGAHANTKDSTGQTPLSWAAERGHVDIVSLLLTKGVDVNCRDEDGRTPLWWAAESNQPQVVKRLLTERDIDMNSKDSEFNQTPLSWAARKGHRRVVEQLLQRRRVEVNSQDMLGQTPLSWAVQKGHNKIVSLLVETEGIDVNRTDSWSRSPLFYAEKSKHLDVIKVLKAAGARAEPDKSKDEIRRNKSGGRP